MDWKGYFKIYQNMIKWLLIPIFIFYSWYFTVLIILYGIKDIDKAILLLSELMIAITPVLMFYLIIMSIFILIEIIKFIIAKPKLKNNSK